MPSSPTKKTFFSKQIPTLFGLAVLVIALAVGILFIGQGAGVFAPRATPQTTPKLIRTSNVTDTSFTVSFLTDEATAGFLKYGKEADKLNLQASDDRDQISGSVSKYTLHHITVRGVEPGTTYYYSLGTGSGGAFTNDGQPFTVTTAKRGGNPTAAKTAYGTVMSAAGTPAENAIVYVNIDGVGELSSLVKASGSWAVPLSNARTSDGSAYATIQDDATMTITVQGTEATNKTQVTTTVSQSQPVATITMGKDMAQTPETPTTASTSGMTDEQARLAVNPSPLTVATASDSASAGLGGLSDLVKRANDSVSASSSAQTASDSAKVATDSAKVVNLESDTPQVVTTTQPIITGQVPSGVKKIKVQVHSENQYDFELIPDANGGFTLDLEKLKAELEPGEHTITYSYTDPKTGEDITKTQTFTVQPTSSQIAQATTGGSTSRTTTSSPSPTPFSSSNPYSIGGATSSAKTSPTPSPSPKTASSSATKGASSSSRVSMPSTASGIPTSGSVGTTAALVLGGIFLMLVGAWSWWAAKEFAQPSIEEE